MKATGGDIRRRVVNRMKSWKVWQLDSELRYSPVVNALPISALPICEVGSGPTGLAAWTPRIVIGVDPGADDRHGDVNIAPNFQRVEGDGANIPLPDASVSAAVAVDTFEHIPHEARAAVVSEMKRVVVDGGRLIMIGPTGPAAAAADAKVLSRWRERGETSGVVEWLSEHQQLGLPAVDELVCYLDGERVRSVRVQGVLNVQLWWLMHRALLGDFSRSRAAFAAQLLLTHPFSALARGWRRGPFYRYLVVAEIGT
jgi:SAM-dependent methyltransferase